MLLAAPQFVTQTCASAAQAALGAVAGGAQSFANLLRSAPATTGQANSANHSPAPEDLAAQLQQRVREFSQLLREKLAAAGVAHATPLTIQLNRAGHVEVEGEATSAADVQQLIDHDSQLRQALVNLQNAHRQWGASATAFAPLPSLGGYTPPEEALRLFVLGDKVELAPQSRSAANSPLRTQ